MQRVKDVMTKDPTCCTPETDVRAVAKLMCEHDCGEIPVVEDEASMRPIGVITDRDITCRVVATGADPTRTKARDCMTGDCLTVHPDMQIDECCRILEDSSDASPCTCGHTKIVGAAIAMAIA